MTPSTELLPRVDDDNAPHWQAARNGQLLVQFCTECRTPRFPAASICCNCGSRDAAWEEVSARGRVLGWCRFHKSYFTATKDQVPYTVLLVKLAAGPQVYMNPAREDERPAIGAEVAIGFEAMPGGVSLMRACVLAAEPGASE